MRPSLLLLFPVWIAPLVAAGAVQPLGEGLPGCPDVDIIHFRGQFLEFSPTCVVLHPDGAVRWVNDHVVAHGPASRLDHGACFDAHEDRVYLPGPGSSYALRFVFDGTHLWSQYGDGPLRSCDAAMLPAASGASAAVVPYVCYVHPDGAPGLLVVRA